MSALTCPQAVKRTHVNIVDLVDTDNTGEEVEIFRSLEKLREYTIDSGKYFPKENAYAGGVLKFLLREILNPWEGRGRKFRGRGRRGGRA